MRYPNAFEVWYKEQVKVRSEELDTIIIHMRDSKAVKDLAEGERRLRKMLYLEWKLVGVG